jgi:hypothetical protein
MPSGHENTDANALAVMWVTIISVVGIIVVLVSLAGAFSFLKSYTESITPQMAPKALLSERNPPPPPLLEVKPVAEYQALFAKERQILESYGWVDQKNGVVRIPIKLAIEILSHER